ncbi:hydrolase 2, exosortase A system-associated [Pelomicrobium sp. G1]|uniref:hydrolase 2, exosortase A system-associated n=1 Tax=unclassified Pelomicrobium TaxID=2815318 RepID=UPI000B0B8CDE
MSPIDSRCLFAPLATGPRFCLLHRPAAGNPRGVVLYLHPFAEEMNKCRRMAALGAQALAAAGFAVLQVDLLGCGDSPGDFGEATWDGWLEDARAAADWLAREQGSPVGWLWGLRAGCLLAAEASRRIESVNGLLLWQPVASGAQHLAQFLRLKSANALLASGSASRRDDLRRKLVEEDQPVEVAGYTLTPALARGLEHATLEIGAQVKRIVWLEVSATTPPVLSPAAGQRIARWQEEGLRVAAHAVAGPPFWQTVEVSECPALVEATISALRASGA